jgi:hypothetical protein
VAAVFFALGVAVGFGVAVGVGATVAAGAGDALGAVDTLGAAVGDALGVAVEAGGCAKAAQENKDRPTAKARRMRILPERG